MRSPSDKSPDPPGGRAAERLREFRKARFPEDKTATEDKIAEDKKADPGADDTQQDNPHRSES